MILNKKQESIYTWLTNKPGYLKCSPKIIAKNYPKESKTKDIEVALQKARLDTKPVSKSQDNNIILSKNFSEDNVLVIGDTHYPFQREGYLEHLLKCRTDYNCGTIVHIGDVIDNAYSSFNETNPSLLNPMFTTTSVLVKATTNPFIICPSEICTKVLSYTLSYFNLSVSA
jgi:hypothetical protein